MITSDADAPVLKVCEFYSGIGGYHIALSQILKLTYKVVAAFEISSNANCIYRANFPHTPVLETNLCGLTAARLNSIIKKAGDRPAGDVVKSRDENMTSRDEHERPCDEVMFVMSPPCQPFTRQGSRKDDLDPRSASVIHLFGIFSQLPSLPDYFFLENVQGFEGSNTRNKIMEFFTQHRYHVVEFLINSNELGIPNSRLRYYLLARRQPFSAKIKADLDRSDLLSFIPGYENSSITPPLSKFLETDPAGYQLSEKFLSKWGRVLDLVTPASTRSCCFTKGYGVKAEGSGSVIQQAPDDTNSCAITPEQHTSSDLTDHRTDNERSVCSSKLEGEEFLKHMKSLNLRFFTPREIARIHGIPEWYEFPDSLSQKQLYKLLGNGLNVTVVKQLIERVLLN